MDATDHSWFENYGKNELTLGALKLRIRHCSNVGDGLDSSNPRKLDDYDYDQTLDCLT
jgi:hypothetical protein